MILAQTRLAFLLLQCTYTWEEKRNTQTDTLLDELNTKFYYQTSMWLPKENSIHKTMKLGAEISMENLTLGLRIWRCGPITK